MFGAQLESVPFAQPACASNALVSSTHKLSSLIRHLTSQWISHRLASSNQLVTMEIVLPDHIDRLFKKHEKNPFLEGLIQIVPFAVGAIANSAILAQAARLRAEGESLLRPIPLKGRHPATRRLIRRTRRLGNLRLVHPGAATRACTPARFLIYVHIASSRAPRG